MPADIQDICRVLESTFELVLIVDSSGQILRASTVFCRVCGVGEDFFVGKALADVLADLSLAELRAGMVQARQGKRCKVLFSLRQEGGCPFPLSASYAELASGGIFIFHGLLGGEPRDYSDWEKDERIKELACLYSVSEWLKVAHTIDEFLGSLPIFLARGMRYPECAVVYSLYQGQEYGQKPSGRYIKTDIGFDPDHFGEIRVGYKDERYEFMPEEQKLINEIGRIANVYLERRALTEQLRLRDAEEEEYSQKLRNLHEEIDRRTREIEEEREKLRSINSYLNRLRGDFASAEQRLFTIFEAIHDRVAIIDRERNLVMTNRKDVAVGQKCYAAIFGRERVCEDCRLARIVKQKTPVTLTLKHEDSHFEVHALPIYDEAHEVTAILEFYRDITREKVYEEQLQQADKLASIGQLVSGIGHEINNPNQFIRGNIQIIRQSFEDILPLLDAYYGSHPELKIARLKYPFFRQNIMTLVQDMCTGSERIKGVVEGLKRFARKDEGELIDDVDVNNIVHESVRLVHTQVHKNAEVKLTLAEDLPKIVGNSQKIEQVMINLIMNASQAMPEDRRGLIEVVTSVDEGDVVIEVRDSGKGMTEQTLKHIFDPFFTTRRARGGTGMGLSIVHRILEEHRGSIAVASRPNVGTTFTLRVPAMRRKE